MKKTIKFKLIFLILIFLGLIYNGEAKEKIWFSVYTQSPSFYLIVSQGKQLTVDWGDGCPVETFTGTGEFQLFTHHYTYNPNLDSLKLIIEGSTPDCIISEFQSSRIMCFDASEAPLIKIIDISNFTSGVKVKSLNLKNCSALEELYFNSNSLDNIDLTDCISLRYIYVHDNQLSLLDISNTVAEKCDCFRNCLPLSQLYPISLKLPFPEYSYLEKQNLPNQNIIVGEFVDFSLEKEFGGIPTVFTVYRGAELAHPNDYSIEDGIITFHSGGKYSITMYNPSIIAVSIPKVTAPVSVSGFAPVREIINVPTIAVAGTPITLTGTVIPYDATYKSISWSVKDTGTTGATITNNKLYTIAEGTVIVSATIKNGLGIDSNYMQDFSIEVKPLGINKQELSDVTVSPNPTNGSVEIDSKNLLINKIEVFNIKGKIVLSHYFNILSTNHRIDLSNLNSGIYFVKVITMQGEFVTKVIRL